MKNAIILHGTSGTPEQFWFPWLKKELEAKGYAVWVPQLPEADTPKKELWIPYILEHGRFTAETIIVGHSAGSPATLAVLEKLQLTIKQAILVAAYFEPVNAITGILQKTYDWQKIKSHVQDITVINSDNDPWHCDDQQGLRLFHHLGGTIILRHGEGHMGSEMYNQPYKEFPFLLQLIH